MMKEFHMSPTEKDLFDSVLCGILRYSMCNSYLNALAAMLESEFSVSLPNLKLGTNRDILDTFLGKFKDETSDLLFIENTFFYLDQAFTSYILLHPKFESLQRILEKLT